jgi:AcrR family transcriptional regulator
MFCDQDQRMRQNRERLLDAAAEVFLEDGYLASIDKIICRAGVVRQTLYNHFEGKDALFAEVIRRVSNDVVVSLEGDPKNVRDTLIEFGMAMREAALSPRGICMFRVLVTEASRFEALARTVYELGPGHTLKQLAKFLGTVMESGQLRRDNSEFAASMLIAMLISHERTRQLFHTQQPKTGSRRKTEQIVDCFLRAFAP